MRQQLTHCTRLLLAQGIARDVDELEVVLQRRVLGKRDGQLIELDERAPHLQLTQ